MHARQSAIRTTLADITHILHLSLTLFFALGWALPWSFAWWTVLLGGAVMNLIWVLWANRCPLTLIESHLRGENPATLPPTRQPHFVAGLIRRLSGVQVSNWVGDGVVYATLYTSMTLSAWRLTS